jgi:cytochrome b561
MTTYDRAFKYSRPLVSLHWLMFLLLIVVYAAVEFRVFYDKGMPEREFMKSLHLCSGGAFCYWFYCACWPSV